MLGTHRWTYRPVVTHLSGRGFISGDKRDREREKGKKKEEEETPRSEALKTHLCLVFCHGEIILRHWPPTTQRYGTKIQPRRLIPANVPRTTTACWAAG